MPLAPHQPRRRAGKRLRQRVHRHAFAPGRLASWQAGKHRLRHQRHARAGNHTRLHSRIGFDLHRPAHGRVVMGKPGFQTHPVRTALTKGKHLPSFHIQGVTYRRVISLADQMPHLLSEGRIDLTAAGLIGRTERSHFQPSRHWPSRCDLRVVRFGLHHPRHFPFANGQRSVSWPMAGRPVLAVLRPGVGHWVGAAIGDATFPGTAPHATQHNTGLLTACFAVGQLAGPLLAAMSSQFSGGLQPALVLAGSGLLVAGGLLLRPVTAAQGLCANDGAPTAQR